MGDRKYSGGYVGLISMLIVLAVIGILVFGLQNKGNKPSEKTEDETENRGILESNLEFKQKALDAKTMLEAQSANRANQLQIE